MTEQRLAESKYVSKQGLPKVISIVGLTASGKSGLGIKLAQGFNGEIISCDSRQVYVGLDIGTAKVTKQEQKLVKHHLIDVVEPRELYNVFEFQKAAYCAIEDILARGKVPFLIGGTGLYSRSVVEGYGFDERVNKRKYDILQICLLPSKEYIEKPIVTRIDTRLAGGMIEETRELIRNGVSAEFLQGLGLEYYWNVEYIEGRISLDEYKKSLATKTMQFAKRQRTWFKKEKDTVFLQEPDKFYQESRKLISLFLT